MTEKKLYLAFDSETSGLPDFKAYSDAPGQPRVSQWGAILFDVEGNELEKLDVLVLQPSFKITPEMTKFHGITQEMVEKDGISPNAALLQLKQMAHKASTMIAHNKAFDFKMLAVENFHCNGSTDKLFQTKEQVCTMHGTTKLVQCPPTPRMLASGFKTFKVPSMQELHKFLFNEEFQGAHNAANDVGALKRCYVELVKRGHFQA